MVRAQALWPPDLLRSHVLATPHSRTRPDRIGAVTDRSHWTCYLTRSEGHPGANPRPAVFSGATAAGRVAGDKRTGMRRANTWRRFFVLTAAPDKRRSHGESRVQRGLPVVSPQHDIGTSRRQEGYEGFPWNGDLGRWLVHDSGLQSDQQERHGPAQRESGCSAVVRRLSWTRTPRSTGSTGRLRAVVALHAEATLESSAPFLRCAAWRIPRTQRPDIECEIEAGRPGGAGTRFAWSSRMAAGRSALYSAFAARSAASAGARGARGGTRAWRNSLKGSVLPWPAVSSAPTPASNSTVDCRPGAAQRFAVLSRWSPDESPDRGAREVLDECERDGGEAAREH